MVFEPWLLAIPGSVVSAWAVAKVMGRGIAKGCGHYMTLAIDRRMPDIEAKIKDGMVLALNGRYPMRKEMQDQFEQLPNRIIETERFRQILRHEIGNALMAWNAREGR